MSQSGSSRIRLSCASVRKAARPETAYEQRARELMLMAAHDLRTPLAAIKMMAQASGRHSHAGVQKSGAQWDATMSRIVRVADSAFGLIDDLLAVERLKTRGGAALAQEVVDVEAIVHEAIELHSDSLKRARCKVTLIRQRTLDSTRGRWDRGLLLRIFSNLLRNVARHAPGAPVRITFMRRGTNSLGVVFADSGSGLPTGLEERVGRSERTHLGGESHGLGLWIVHRAVEGLHGSLRIRNAPGCGVAFDIELPGLQI